MISFALIRNLKRRLKKALFKFSVCKCQFCNSLDTVYFMEFERRSPMCPSENGKEEYSICCHACRVASYPVPSKESAICMWNSRLTRSMDTTIKLYEEYSGRFMRWSAW